MFIQCQHCQATYKIDEQKIPDQDSFVRCAKCSNEIPLGKKAQTALSQQQPKKIVECDNCGIRYSIPIDKIQQESIPVRCGKCGNVFSVSRDDDDKQTKPIEKIEVDRSFPFEDELPSTTENEINDDDVDLDNISIPEESEIEMDNLFGDIENDEELENESEDENSFDDSVFAQNDVDESDFEDMNPNDPKKEYLDSVNLKVDDEDESAILDDDMEIDTISDEEKSKLFLQPDSSESNDFAMEGTNWPEIEDETEISADSTDIESEIAEFGEMDELSAMPDTDEENALELQEIPVSKTGNKKWWVFFILSILIIGGAVAWFHFRDRLTQVPLSPMTEEYNQKSRLTILEPLSGRFITNRFSNKRIFILEGNLKNIFSSQTRISWIEVKGALYNKNGEKISESTSFAGSKISDTEFANFSNEDIAIRLQGEQQKELNLNLVPEQTTKFQIVFFNVPERIQKLEAKISRFGKLPENE